MRLSRGEKDRLRDSLLAEARGRPLIMGILNVTPDSFSDGGKFDEAGAALAHAEAMEKLADAIGGEDGLNTQVNGVGLRVEAIAERIEALRNSGLDISTGNLGEVAEALDRISDFMPGKNGK